MSNDTQPEIRFPGFTEAWEQRKLDDVVEFYSGLTYSPDNVQDDGTFVLRSSNVKNGEIIDADNVYVSHEVVNSGNVQEGDVIVVVRNGSRDLIGKHAQIKRQMDNTVIGAFMTGVRSETPDFTNAMLDTQQFAVEINKNLGATINQITTGAFKKMQFVVPKDRDEREAIGTFFRSIDDTITLHQRKLDLLKETKKGFLQKMFPKNGAKVPEIRFPGFTKDWEQRKLGDFVVDYVEKTSVQNQFPMLTSSQQKGIVLQEDYFANRQVTTENNIGYFVLPRGYFTFRSRSDNDVFVFNRNDIIDRGIISYFYPVFTLKSADSDFFLRRINNGIQRQLSIQAEGTGQHVLSLKKFKNIVAMFPSEEEQQKIGTFFKQLDDTITLHQRKLDLLKETKKGFLQKMFV
ncbi:restriction endonuclease subunit S [Enterococcus hirae]|uniref:restriction endonuclease subunit S n=1 Tax=Enterococcus hirae TaxID=1354 RepID=UPI001899D4FF|nr:restriction endonuclease subunit S [Enterococcus hirae]